MKFSLVSAAMVLGFAGPYGFAEDAQKIEPSTCYLSSAWGFGQVTCTDEKGTPSELKAAEVDVQSSRDQESNEVRLTITGIASHDNVWGTYSLKGEDGEVILVDIKPLDTVAQVRAGRGGGGGGYRGGGGGYRGGGYRGGGVAYRGGGVYRRGYGGVAAGAIVGGAAAAAAGSYYGGNYCDPNYQNCGYGYGSGYYAPGVVGGAVVGAGVAAARRGGYAYRGGGYRGGGAHVAHRGGGGYRGGGGRRR